MEHLLCTLIVGDFLYFCDSVSDCGLADFILYSLLRMQLHERLVTAVDSESFLTRLQSLREGSVNGTANEFPFKEPSGMLSFVIGAFDLEK